MKVFNYFENEWRDAAGNIGQFKSQEPPNSPQQAQFLESREIGHYLSGSDGFISHFTRADQTRVARTNDLQRAMSKRNNIQDWLEKYSREHQNVYWC